jgi:AbrB family looped-hinge helix DNA binding protein
MPAATVTSKGQITIPKEVRERLKLKAGDRVVFVVQSDNDVVLKPAKTDIRTLYGMLYRKGRRARTIEEMDQGVTDLLSEKHRRR